MNERMVAVGWGGLVFGVGLLALGCSGSSAVVGGNEVGGTGGQSPNAPEQDSVKRYSDPITSRPGLCLARELPLNANGSAACKIFAATLTAGGACACDTANRAPVSDKTRDAVRALAKESFRCDEPDLPACADYCVCEDLPVANAELSACLSSEEANVDGWCYVSPDVGLGSLDARCEGETQATVRFLGNAVFSEAEDGFIFCSETSTSLTKARPLGSVCVPSDEGNPAFSGFRFGEVAIDADATGCLSGVCVVQQFQGRVSCPFGSVVNAGECLLPGSNERVTVEVKPQLVDRAPSVAATCSCRCAGPGDGPFCACGEGLDCVPLVADIGLPGDSQAGSYCLPKGATEPSDSVDTCLDVPDKCGDRLY